MGEMVAASVPTEAVKVAGTKVVKEGTMASKEASKEATTVGMAGTIKPTKHLTHRLHHLHKLVQDVAVDLKEQTGRCQWTSAPWLGIRNQG